MDGQQNKDTHHLQMFYACQVSKWFGYGARYVVLIDL